jgi:hypothetical protein
MALRNKHVGVSSNRRPPVLRCERIHEAAAAQVPAPFMVDRYEWHPTGARNGDKTPIVASRRDSHLAAVARAQANAA